MEIEEKPTTDGAASSGLVGLFTETFGLGRGAAIWAILLIGLVLASAIFWFFHSAPPNTITITTGPKGSAFQVAAEKYRKILARSGVKLDILSSQGSLENLKRLGDPRFRVDIGFVQGGITNGIDTSKLVTLGSVAYEPLLVFYRNPTPFNFLSDFSGKHLSIGPVGSGTRSLSETLLGINGISNNINGTVFTDESADDATKALIDSNVDAVFFTADSASPQDMRLLLHAPGVQLFSFTQADAYARRIHYLSKLVLPQGAIDFGKNVPAQDVNLVAPNVELIARAKLHPALIDLLLEAAREIHGNATMFQDRGQFPAPQEVDIRLSDEARRYYTSGKSFLYRSLPFWLASQVNRILVVIVPMLFVLIPGLRLIPTAYQWQIRLRIYRAYRGLLRLEKEVGAHLSAREREDISHRIDHIEKNLNRMRVPASFGNDFYTLRGHIATVRGKLVGSGPAH